MAQIGFAQRLSKGGGAIEGTRPAAQALGAQQHTFCSHFKRIFKYKFRPKYALKCVFFGKKL